MFQEALQFCGRFQQRGDIQAFEPVALEPHGGHQAGFLLIKRDAYKLARVRASEEMTALNTRAELVLEGRPADRREVLSVT